MFQRGPQEFENFYQVKKGAFFTTRNVIFFPLFKILSAKEHYHQDFSNSPEAKSFSMIILGTKKEHFARKNKSSWGWISKAKVKLRYVIKNLIFAKTNLRR